MIERDPAVIQQEIERLQQELADKRVQTGQDAAAPYERAEVRDALGERSGPEGAAAPQASPVAPTASSSGDQSSWQDPALSTQVQGLVNVAFTQGVQAAVDQAKKTGNAALVDALHDILADELHQELLARQKVAPAA